MAIEPRPLTAEERAYYDESLDRRLDWVDEAKIYAALLHAEAECDEWRSRALAAEREVSRLRAGTSSIGITVAPPSVPGAELA